MALTKRLLRGSTVTIVGQVVKLLLMFVTTPLMVSHLGERNYGIWLLALTIISYLRFLDLGVSLAGTRFLGKAIGSSDPKGFNELFSSISYLFNRIGLAALAGTFFLSLLLPILLPDNTVIQEIRWIILGLGITTSIRFWTQIFEVILKSHVRYDLIGLTAIVKTILQGGLIIYFLTTGSGLNALLLIFIATDIIDQLLLFFFARRLYPEARILFVRKGGKEVPNLVRYSATSTVTSIGMTLRNGVDPLIVGWASGVTMVPVYSIGSRFLTVFSDLINAIFGGNFLAAFSQLDGRNDPKALTSNFLKSIRFSSAISIIGGCALAILGPPFILKWIGNSFSDSATVLHILLLPTTLSLMQYPVWSFFYSQNKQVWLAWVIFGGGILNITLSVILSLKIGFFGVVWATFVEMMIVFGSIVPLLTARLCSISLVNYAWTLLRGAIPVFATASAYYFSIRAFLQPNYLVIGVAGVGLMLVMAPVVWWCVLTQDDREHLMASLRSRRTAPRQD